VAALSKDCTGKILRILFVKTISFLQLYSIGDPTPATAVDIAVYCIYIISVQSRNPDASHKEAVKRKH